MWKEAALIKFETFFRHLPEVFFFVYVIVRAYLRPLILPISHSSFFCFSLLPYFPHFEKIRVVL
jgi:hypothetical protein